MSISKISFKKLPCTRNLVKSFIVFLALQRAVNIENKLQHKCATILFLKLRIVSYLSSLKMDWSHRQILRG